MTWTAAQGALRALALAVLLLAVLSMHSLGLGHGASVQGPHDAHVASAAMTFGNAASHGPATGDDVGGGHQEWTQVCLAVIGTLALAALLAPGLLSRRGSTRRRPRSSHWRPLHIPGVRPPPAPCLHRLCVLRM